MASIDPIPIIILSVILALVTYALWMFLKKIGIIYSWVKKGDAMHKKEDEAFNQLNLLRGLMKSMRAKGRDVSRAAAMVRKAAEAFENGEYNKVLEMADDIKQALITSPEISPGGLVGAGACGDIQKKDILDEKATTDKVKPDETETPMMVLKREKPPNYMESKFMLQKAELTLASEEKKGRDVSQAMKNLTQGKKAFENRDYDAALSYAVKALKEFDPSMFTPLENKEESEKSEHELSAETPEKEETTEIVKGKKCNSCGSICEPGDAFCYNCGERLMRRCECGRELKSEDKFCRGCGRKV